MGEATKKEGRGTNITIMLKDNEKDFSEKIRIETIVKKYSDHISHSVYISEKDSKDQKEEKVNQGLAIWTKDKKDIKDKEYQEFYSSIGMNYDKPWKIIHNKIEGNLNYTNLI